MKVNQAAIGKRFGVGPISENPLHISSDSRLIRGVQKIEEAGL